MSKQELTHLQTLLSTKQNNLLSHQNTNNQLTAQIISANSEHALLAKKQSENNKTLDVFGELHQQYIPLDTTNATTTQTLVQIISSEDILLNLIKDACKSKKIEDFDSAIAKLQNINYQDSDGKTLLIHAIENGFWYGVDRLLERKIDINIVDNNGANALIYCVLNNHLLYIKKIALLTSNIPENILHIITIKTHQSNRAVLTKNFITSKL
jgi:ankyrin repeat protein